MGLELSGFRHVALVERDRHSCANLRENSINGFGLVAGWKVIESDVREIDYSRFGENVRLVAGGPPCQPFSLGGKHQAYNDRRDMFPEAVRAIRELKPEAFVFENVRGLLRKSFATYFNYIVLQLTYPELARSREDWPSHLKRLEKRHTGRSNDGLTYKVVFRLLNAADYGIPQTRHRVIIVGFRSDLDARWSFPDPTHSRESLLYSQWVTGEYWDSHKIGKRRRPTACAQDKAKIERLKSFCPASLFPAARWLTVRDAIAGLPEPGTGLSKSVPNHEFRPGARTYAGHTGSLLDEPSKTLKAGDHGVPGGENTVLLDDGEVRYYTVRESARIQTFPDEFVFCGSWTENMRQLGNAVPVKLAEQIGNSIAIHLKAAGTVL